MLSCALSENWNTLKMDVSRSGSAKASASESAPFEHRKSRRNYYPSEGIAKAHLHKVSAALSNGVEHLNIESGPTSTTSSTGAPVSDLSASTTPPSSYQPLRTTFEPRESLATSLSTSPEQIRRTHRSSPNLTAFGASLARPPTLSASVASSPPRNLQRKRSSPAGSYLGVSTSTSTWSPSQYFGRSSSIIVEDPKSSFTLSVSDTEDEAPQAVKEPLFSTSLKNQERFHNDGYADIALLDPQQEWRYRAYRELYAHLLYIWNLPIVRGELLKYNGAPTADASLPGRMPASLATSKARLASTTFHSNVPRLDYRDHCSKCNIVLTKGSLNRHCQNCSSRQTPPICLLCNTFIYGLSSPCLHCGHVLHNSCREMLISQTPEDVPSECISGCGCICTNHAGFEIMSGEYVATRADLSPAASVTGDAVTNEQEQLGWYDNSEWEDMAYKSLARNLRPRREVKPKSSQIWRGRNQST